MIERGDSDPEKSAHVTFGIIGMEPNQELRQEIILEAIRIGHAFMHSGEVGVDEITVRALRAIAEGMEQAITANVRVLSPTEDWG